MLRDEIEEVIEEATDNAVGVYRSLTPFRKPFSYYSKKILTLPVGGEVEEDCDIFNTPTDIYKDCSHCEHLKEDQNEWYCGTEGKITRPRTIAYCEEE